MSEKTSNQLAAEIVASCRQFEWHESTLRLVVPVDGVQYQVDIKVR